MAADDFSESINACVKRQNYGMEGDEEEEAKIESNRRFRRGRSLPGADSGGPINHFITIRPAMTGATSNGRAV